jgi:hypothetical protein
MKNTKRQVVIVVSVLVVRRAGRTSKRDWQGLSKLFWGKGDVHEGRGEAAATVAIEKNLSLASPTSIRYYLVRQGTTASIVIVPLPPIELGVAGSAFVMRSISTMRVRRWWTRRVPTKVHINSGLLFSPHNSCCATDRQTDQPNKQSEHVIPPTCRFPTLVGHRHRRHGQQWHQVRQTQGLLHPRLGQWQGDVIVHDDAILVRLCGRYVPPLHSLRCDRRIGRRD